MSGLNGMCFLATGDVEASDVDLDAWFADRDVQAYVERLDRQEARRSDPAPVSTDDDWPSLFGADPAPASEESAASAQDDSDGLAEDGEGFHIAVPRSVLIAIGSGLAVLAVLAAVISSSRARSTHSLSQPPRLIRMAKALLIGLLVLLIRLIQPLKRMSRTPLPSLMQP